MEYHKTKLKGINDIMDERGVISLLTNLDLSPESL